MNVLRVGLVLFLVGAIANNADARVDPDAIAEARMDLLTSVAGPFNAFSIFNSKPTKSQACCDKCICSKSDYPECGCADTALNKCPKGCKGCVCIKSYPPQCRCLDRTHSCLPKCSTRSSLH